MRPIIDSHLDLAWSALFWNRDLSLPLEEMRQAEAHMEDHPARARATLTLPELAKGNIRVCLGTVLSRSKPNVCPTKGFDRRDLDFRNQIHACAIGRAHVEYYRQLEIAGLITQIRTAKDLQNHHARWNEENQPLGLILAMEGADPIVSPEQAVDWWDLGLRCVGLAHYGQGSYAAGTGMEGPLKPEGKRLLDEFSKLGMIIDLTHTAEPGFYEVLDHFGGPVLASHNMCRALTPADRQFSDEQLKRLFDRNAVIGVAFDAWMIIPKWVTGVTPPESVTLEDVANHVDHMCQIAGTSRQIAIGSDLDGGFGNEQTPYDLKSICDLHKLEDILARRGYSDSDIDGIFWGNWLRYFLEALPA